MSSVTDVILTTAIDDGGKTEDDHPNVNLLNSWLIENRKGVLLKVDNHAGGNKAMQCDVFMGAFNYLALNEFINIFHDIPWEQPESVQLMMKLEHDDAFVMYELTNEFGL